jgi:hypothetical protein
MSVFVCVTYGEPAVYAYSSSWGGPSSPEPPFQAAGPARKPVRRQDYLNTNYIFHAQKVGQSFGSAAGLLPGVLRRRTEQFFTDLAAACHSEAPSGSSVRRAEALPHRDALKM